MNPRELHQMALDALKGVLDAEKGLATQFWSVSGGVYEAVQCNAAIAALQAAIDAPSAEPAVWSESAIDEYLSGYSLIGDDGDYTPTDDERFVIKDAIIGFMSVTPKTKNCPSIEDIQQAVALGWCSDRNLLKRMDSDLATDIADQVYALLNKETPLYLHPSVSDQATWIEYLNHCISNQENVVLSQAAEIERLKSEVTAYDVRMENDTAMLRECFAYIHPDVEFAEKLKERLGL